LNSVGETTWTDPSDAEIERVAGRILEAIGPVDAETIGSVGALRMGWINDLDELEDEKLSFLLRHWQNLAEAAAGVPPRAALDVLDLIPAVGNLMLLDVERDGFDATYRVYGTKIADRAAHDWTGFRVSEMNRITRTPASLMYRSCYRAVFRRPAPLFSEHGSPRYLSALSWRRLILPVAGTDHACEQFLVGNLPVGSRYMTEQEIEDRERILRGAKR